MKLEQALADIESVEFDARINVVSGMRGFFSAASQEAAVKEVYREMRASGGVAEEVLGRIYDLARLSVDLRYENPKDTAMSVLLWLMLSVRLEYAQLAAQYVDRAQQCWYAKKLARSIIFPTPVASGDSRVDEESQVLQAATIGSNDSIISLQPFTTSSRPIYRNANISTLSASA